MRRLTLLLVVCAAMAAQSALAQDLAAIRAACTEDAQKLCGGVQPGGGRIVACLKQHKDELSDRCKQAAGLAANPSSSSAPGDSSSPAPSSRSGAGPSVPAAAAVPATVTAKPAVAPKASASKTSASKASTAKASPAKGTEKFSERVITDTEHGGMRAATIHLPEKWHFESKIEWHYDRIEVPLIFSSHAENPDNAEAYFQYPLLRAEIVDAAPQYRQYIKNNAKPGDRLPSGAIWSPPLPPMQAMAKFIQQTCPNAANFKWLGQQDLPDLAKALHMDPWPGDHGVPSRLAMTWTGNPWRRLSLAFTSSPSRAPMR